MQWRTSNLMTIGGIMAAFGLAAPPAMGQANLHAPNWLNLTCFLIGAIGMAIVGVAGKGQSEPSLSADQIKQIVQDHLASQQTQPPKP